jgi:hypothetical protein
MVSGALEIVSVAVLTPLWRRSSERFAQVAPPSVETCQTIAGSGVLSAVDCGWPLKMR